VNPALATAGEETKAEVVIQKVKEAELDEMWSYVGRKKQPRWLWEALDHQTGRVVAFVFGRREDQALLQLKALLVPLGIRRFYFILTAGGCTVGTWIHTDMESASGEHNSWSGNISRCARGSNA
jgi:IS1 family transposase